MGGGGGALLAAHTATRNNEGGIGERRRLTKEIAHHRRRLRRKEAVAILHERAAQAENQAMPLFADAEGGQLGRLGRRRRRLKPTSPRHTVTMARQLFGPCVLWRPKLGRPLGGMAGEPLHLIEEATLASSMALGKRVGKVPGPDGMPCDVLQLLGGKTVACMTVVTSSIPQPHSTCRVLLRMRVCGLVSLGPPNGSQGSKPVC